MDKIEIIKKKKKKKKRKKERNWNWHAQVVTRNYINVIILQIVNPFIEMLITFAFVAKIIFLS